MKTKSDYICEFAAATFIGLMADKQTASTDIEMIVENAWAAAERMYEAGRKRGYIRPSS